jgi:hypothetical protein
LAMSSSTRTAVIGGVVGGVAGFAALGLVSLTSTLL